MWRQSEAWSGHQRKVSKRYVCCLLSVFSLSLKQTSSTALSLPPFFFFPPESPNILVLLAQSLSLLPQHTYIMGTHFVPLWPICLVICFTFLHSVLCSGQSGYNKTQCSAASLWIQTRTGHTVCCPPFFFCLERQKNRSRAKNRQEANLSNNFYYRA